MRLAGERSVVESLVWTDRVMKVHVRSHYVIKVLVSEHHEEIQAFVASGFDPSFDECNLIGSLRSCHLNFAIVVLIYPAKVSTVLVVAVS